MKRTIKVFAADGMVRIPLRGKLEPTATVAIGDIQGASMHGCAGANVYLPGMTLDTDLDDEGFAALLRVLVSEFEQQALKADDVEQVPFS